MTEGDLLDRAGFLSSNLTLIYGLCPSAGSGLFAAVPQKPVWGERACAFSSVSVQIFLKARLSVQQKYCFLKHSELKLPALAIASSRNRC